MSPEDSTHDQQLGQEPPRRSSKWRLGTALAVVTAVLVVGGGSFVAYAYASTPAAVRQPRLEHYHLRMQAVVDRKAVSFAGPDFQTTYDKSSCSADVPKQPFHFHDGANQFAHVHWEGMTGGLLLKYYGWNFLGGSDDALGRQFHGLRPGAKVPIHGTGLGPKPAASRVFVYTGDANSFKQRDFDDWLRQDFEKFFSKTSNAPAHRLNQQSVLHRLLVPTANAAEAPTEVEKEELNNLLGNVVLFVQDKQPSDGDVRARFDALQTLPSSVCAG